MLKSKLAIPKKLTDTSSIASTATASSVGSAFTAETYASSISGASSGKGENVIVCVRVRPLNRLEERTKQREAWVLRNDREIIQNYFPASENKYANSNVAAKDAPAQNKGASTYAFDHVFTPDKDNVYVYERIGLPIITGCMEGYHGCIFAYGQTSSGKTHTIHGSANQPGMIPQSVQSVFDWIEDHPEREYVLRVSYMEIYNEIVNDLLNPANTNLRIREDKKKGIFVEGLKEDIVVGADQVFSLLHAGTSHRHIGRTNYNDVSSRSHTVFRMVVESSSRDNAKGGVRVSALNLVDLAGSENAVKAGSEDRIKETGYINKSLLTLGHVIFKLSEGSTDHIPYRDSKLTRILQSSLGGKARVSICCNISPSSGNIDESLSTLKFAARAKKIVNYAALNEKSDDSTLLSQYREEIDRLKTELVEARAAAAAAQIDPIVTQEALDLVERNEQEKLALQAKIEQLTRLILTSSQPVPPPQVREATPAPLLPSSSVSSNISVSHRPTFKGRMPGAYPLGNKRNKTMIYGTLPRDFNMATAMRSFENLPDLDQVTGDQAVDDLLPAEHKKTPRKELPEGSVEALKAKLQQMTDELEKTKAELRESREHSEVIQKELEEKDILLQEWDTYFVTTNNKHIAISNEIRRVAAHTQQTSELSHLFSLLDLSEDDFNSPLVDYTGTLARSDSTKSIPSSVKLPSPESDKFNGIMSRWKSLEQDL